MPWFAVIDAAQDDSAPGKARASGLRTQSLYAGELGARVEHVAPHLSTFALDGAFAGWLSERWGGNHGILLQSSASFEDLRRHLRKFLLVKDEGGTKYRFRFYDPRALRSFLPACSFEEAKEFFGPVIAYYAAGRSGESVLAFGWRPRGLTVREYPVSTAATSRPDQQGAAPADQARPPTGDLVVMLLDAQSGEPIVGASLQVSGPVTRTAVSGQWGETRFESIATGHYEIFAIDPQHRCGKGAVTVTEGTSQARLSCRPSSSPS